MRFDDRLRTVLNHPADSAHERAVRWRQLVDLLARAGTLEASIHAPEALEVIRNESRWIDQNLRAAAARAIAALPLPFELVALFARDSIAVSAPVIAAARLTSRQWAAILDQASAETAQFVGTLHPEAVQGRAPPETHRPTQASRPTEAGMSPELSKPAEPGTPSDAALVDVQRMPTIEEVIHRIEALREVRHRDAEAPLQIAASAAAATPEQAAPQVVQEEEEPARLFRWECGPSGELEWVDGAPRAALIGRALAGPPQDRNGGSGEIARAFARRAPFSNAIVALAEDTMLAGEWELSGAPAFDHLSGRFEGYRGIARRLRSSRAAGAKQTVPDPDSLRELVHEIKTPLNAIMGFAQIIEGQMFGPAGASYRERAAEIVAQSHLLLAAIEDLDLAAKLQAGGDADGNGSDLSAILEGVIPALDESANAAGVELCVIAEPDLPSCSIGAAVVERLVRRMVAGLIDCCGRGERLDLVVAESNGNCTIAASRPASLAGVSDEHLLDPAFSAGPQRNARLSLGFSLRLVRGIAQLAGGDLKIGSRKLTLVLGQADLRPAAPDRYRHYAG